MNERSDIERALALWFDDGPTVMPDRVATLVADRIGHTRQRGRWRLHGSPLGRNGFVRIAVAIVAVIVIGIVGFNLFRGGDNPTVGPPVASPTATPTVAPSSAPPTATPATPSPSVEVGVIGACALMTPDEAKTALRVSSAIEARSLLHLDLAWPAPFPSATCAYVGGATPLVALAYEKETGADAFAIWKRQSGVEPVSGLGDDAVWDPALTTLRIVKGHRLVTIEPLDATTPTLTLDVARAIGAFVVKRM